MKKPAVAIVLGLLLAVALFVGGYFVGRAKLEHEWRLPPMVLSEADVSRLKVPEADPVPKAGTKILKAMPLQRARITLAELTDKDPVKVTLGSIGRGDDGTSLTLVVQNGAPCEVTSVEGVAYGFAANGASAKVNKAGEYFVAFASKEGEKIASKAKANLSWSLKHPETASLAIAQVDRYRCADGTSWSRN